MNSEYHPPSFASQVKGYLSEYEGNTLFKLALEAAVHGPCMEIGSFCGKSAVYLGTACKARGVTLFTIDHHTGSEEQQPGQLFYDPEIWDDRKGEIDSFPLLKTTLRKARLEDTVVPMVTWSQVAAKNWMIPLSLVFIDGGHTYEAAHTDYLCWHKHLIVGGYLIFHDIYPDPAKGGQAPYEVYKQALSSGQFDEQPMVDSLGILKKRRTVMVQ
ncbi:MAG: class I SAM-dependent methyltransferase [Dehalococcoidia bacterium]|nr:class I SAM-dependent methyltransferase [Dehalococcoidia bacterium]